jgi:hypothetical protein
MDSAPRLHPTMRCVDAETMIAWLRDVRRARRLSQGWQDRACRIGVWLEQIARWRH